MPAGPALALLRTLKPRVCAACAPAVEARLDAEVRQAEADQVQAERLARWETICPPLYRDTDPARLPGRLVAAAAAWSFSSLGLAFVGPSGRGKTRAMMLVGRRMVMDEGRTFAFVAASTFSHEVSRRAGSGTPGDLDNYLHWLCRVHVLFLDDVGKGRLTDRVEAEFYHVIEQRTAHCRPILFTANARAADLQAGMSEDRGEPIVRRLREFCRVEVA